MFTSNAQRQASIWYFGDRAGLSFQTENQLPVALTNGALSTFEGCATISDEQGNLLFYTDGVTVHNRMHQVMKNGTALRGSDTSTQSALIVPWPGQQKFYVFTVDAQGSNPINGIDSTGLRYSVVDMARQGGLGEVVEKNTGLYSPTTEKLAAVAHGNGRDYWLVSHEWDSDFFFSYLITPAGLNPTPVKSKTGSIHTGANGINALGQMKLSPNGRSLALAITAANTVEFFLFDNQSGKIELIESFKPPYKAQEGPYGVEFSPNSKLLYVSEFMNPGNPRGSIYQWQLGAGSVAATQFEIRGVRNQMGSLQLALDGSIYVAIARATYVGRVTYPNRAGAACEFDSVAVGLKTGLSHSGLPGFVQSWFKPPSPEVNLPNVFTPNEDEQNPVFKPLVFEHIEVAQMKIYNRWGQLLFITHDPTSGWNGGEHPAGTYFWQITGEGADGTEVNKKGWLQLVR